jgi:hypothetical protein
MVMEGMDFTILKHSGGNNSQGLLPCTSRAGTGFDTDLNTHEIGAKIPQSIIDSLPISNCSNPNTNDFNKMRYTNRAT